MGVCLLCMLQSALCPYLVWLLCFGVCALGGYRGTLGALGRARRPPNERSEEAGTKDVNSAWAQSHTAYTMYSESNALVRE
eukprot:scaffold2131_cov113-Isochrysis_galbana.AAC.7